MAEAGIRLSKKCRRREHVAGMHVYAPNTLLTVRRLKTRDLLWFQRMEQYLQTNTAGKCLDPSSDHNFPRIAGDNADKVSEICDRIAREDAESLHRLAQPPT